ncbi:DEAD/DEAH box helicase [Carpediemonas membranifera]|uniref:ATP-dependent RNA helicase n=1 Tax=Carpediemonas membranifera TaxID=201153 RepID=A0A8J6B3P8_9EUKA|nr:DEAD/DEAH box helicase [Carpediemonas membranifera]|eukprot:KAG9395058.1 DEAD/DEAH box helicase [Carpediemonas membranifera]
MDVERQISPASGHNWATPTSHAFFVGYDSPDSSNENLNGERMASQSSWDDLAIGSSLVEAVKDIAGDDSKPYDLQKRAIEAILAQKNVCIKAPTGQGKTLAFALPMMRICLDKLEGGGRFTGLLLVPSTELCGQTQRVITSLIKHTGRSDISVNILTAKPVKRKTATTPSFHVCTPQTLHANLEAVPALDMLVIDEAEAILTGGADGEQLQANVEALMARGTPQWVVASATLSEDVSRVMESMTATIDGEGPEYTTVETAVAAGEFRHTLIRATHSDQRLSKMLALVGFFMVARNKLSSTIIFTRSVDTAYAIHMVLSDHSAAKTVVLNPAFPLESKRSIVAAFDAGRKNVLIAVDDDAHPDADESSVARGIDFQGAATVVHFDEATTPEQYTHRSGRAGRAGEEGQSITLSPTPAAELGARLGVALTEHKLDAAAMEAFKYRVNDSMRRATPAIIREIQAAEMRQEMVNNERLRDFFQANPQDRAALNHANVAVGPSRKHKAGAIPDYLSGDVKAMQRSTHGLQIRGMRTKRQQEKVTKRRRAERKAEKKKSFATKGKKR